MQKEDFEHFDANFPKQDKVQGETLIKFATVVQNLAVTIDCAKNYMCNLELVSTLAKKLSQSFHVAHLQDFSKLVKDMSKVRSEVNFTVMAGPNETATQTVRSNDVKKPTITRQTRWKLGTCA
jgi:hypothetical protein